MASLLSYVNRLLPFATPGTPLLQDLIHLAAICGVLYFAPQIQEWYRNSAQRSRQAQPLADEHEAGFRTQDHDANTQDGPQNNHVPTNVPPPPAVEDDDSDSEASGDEADFPVPDEEGAAAGRAAPGPAAPRNIDRGPVGAKKAKALARRDQRRAYHEFQRAQGDAQRAKDAEGAAEREAELARERERRRAAEAAVEAKKAAEREAKRELERKERENEIRRREEAVAVVRADLEAKGMCELDRVARRLEGDVDVEWIERIIRAAGLLGRKEDVTTMITSTGWVVRVSAEDMRMVYQRALELSAKQEDGKISFGSLGGMLEERLRQVVPV